MKVSWNRGTTEYPRSSSVFFGCSNGICHEIQPFILGDPNLWKPPNCDGMKAAWNSQGVRRSTNLDHGWETTELVCGECWIGCFFRKSRNRCWKEKRKTKMEKLGRIHLIDLKIWKGMSACHSLEMCMKFSPGVCCNFNSRIYLELTAVSPEHPQL